VVYGLVGREAFAAEGEEVPDEYKAEMREAERPPRDEPGDADDDERPRRADPGLAHALATTVPRMARRKLLSAASTMGNGLSRMRMLMVLEARKTMKNAAIETGIMMPL